MRYFTSILLLIVTCMSCRAQISNTEETPGPTVSIDHSIFETPDNSYFKDINNEFDKFIGTWFFANENSSLTITLEKREMVKFGSRFEDVLVGEYKFMENGIETVNTLPLLNNSLITVYKHSIIGNTIYENDSQLTCDECSPNERRVNLNFKDPDRPHLRAQSITLRYLVGSNPEQLTAILIAEDGSILPTEDSPTTLRVPYGTYLMTKQ